MVLRGSCLSDRRTYSPVGLGLSTVKKPTTGEHANAGSESILVTDPQTGNTLFVSIESLRKLMIAVSLRPSRWIVRSAIAL